MFELAVFSASAISCKELFEGFTDKLTAFQATALYFQPILIKLFSSYKFPV